MRKHIITLCALVLMMALAVPALAMGTREMYVTKDGVKVYDAPSKHANVIGRVYKGMRISFIDASSDGKWYGYYDSGDTCWVQKKYLSANEPCDHEWSKWRIEKQATCTHSGLRTRYCKLCGLDQEETIKKKAHSFGSWRLIREATCQREGLRTHKCVNCGYEEDQRIDKVPHTFGPWVITVMATDHSAGRHTRTCEVCGTQENEDYDPEGTLRRGNRGDDVRKLQQLLADQGYLNQGGVDGSFGGGTETAIKQFQREQGLEPDGVAWPQTQKRLVHEYGPWEVSKPLTRTSDGVRVRTCKVCNRQETETIPAVPAFLRRARGEDVRTVQKMLNDLGYNAGTADGIYGGMLDTAFTAFARDAGFAYLPGSVNPSEVDQLVNRWIATQATLNWMGAGDRTSPVQLTLTVVPLDVEGGLRTFRWTLTNLGSRRCNFTALLLGFGADHTFKADNLVMVLDNAQLMANAGNTMSGTFNVSTDWNVDSADTFRFCALATLDNNTQKWLSNTVTLPVNNG